MMKAQTLVNSQGLSTHSSRAVAGGEGTMLNWGTVASMGIQDVPVSQARTEHFSRVFLPAREKVLKLIPIA